jgi:hypothetical protein
MSELPQCTEVVSYGPTLDDLTVVETKHLHRRGSEGLSRRRLSRRRLSHETTRIGGGSRIPAYHQFTLGDDFLHVDPEIGQHRSQHRNDTLNIFWTTRLEWIPGVVSNVVGGNDFIGYYQVAPPP